MEIQGRRKGQVRLRRMDGSEEGKKGAENKRKNKRKC
jgi:hypothetical protein